MGRDNGNLNTLKPQPGQTNSYNPTFHPLPGVWARQQMEKESAYSDFPQSTQMKHGSIESSRSSPIKRALASEREQHEYWEKWQGVSPGKPVYEDPRAFQNTLLPVSKYGTDGRGD